MRYGLALMLVLGACSAPSEKAHMSDGEVQEMPSATKGAAGAGDGPFGINAGMALNDLDVDGEADAETGISVLKAPPKPSTQFPLVAVVGYPETGACEVRSVSTAFDSDSYIVDASAFADEVASALKAKYGETKLDEGCNGFSCDSEFKLQHIQDGSYWYRYEWKSSADKKLPNRISEIYLSVIHAQFNDSQVRLDYIFDNMKSCKAAADNAKSSAL